MFMLYRENLDYFSDSVLSILNIVSYENSFLKKKQQENT